MESRTLAGASRTRGISLKRVWRAFETNEITHSGAHYLLAIHEFSRRAAAARAADIARSLGVTRAAASLQVRSLVDHGLIEYGPSRRVHLTERGASLVARVSSKREVLRVFLSEILGVRGEIAALDSCKVEHLLSEETGAALVRLLHFLRSDHPTARACLDAFHQVSAECPGGQRCELCSSVCLIALAPENPSDETAAAGARS